MYVDKYNFVVILFLIKGVVSGARKDLKRDYYYYYHHHHHHHHHYSFRLALSWIMSVTCSFIEQCLFKERKSCISVRNEQLCLELRVRGGSRGKTPSGVHNPITPGGTRCFISW
jgi:hypothetical protein